MTQSSNNIHNHPLNFKMKNKKKSNKLQGKRSHVKYRQKMELKKLQESQKISENTLDNIIKSEDDVFDDYKGKNPKLMSNFFTI